MDLIKKELIKRYKYIYENAEYILAPFVSSDLCTHLILPDNLLLDLEVFLLSDIQVEESKFYKEFEHKKNNLNYMNTVKDGIVLLNKKNENLGHTYLVEELDSWKLYSIVRNFILEQSGDLKNKNKKLDALDEYFRINRYSNDGKIWISGATYSFKDMDNMLYSSIAVVENCIKPGRDKKDIGLKNGNFINIISDYSNHYENLSMLTEQEKQEIYLTYHDELPWNLEKTCEIEDECITTMIETRLIRPEHTIPCGENFNIYEDEIFVNPKDTLYRYYQICPHCGWIVNIPKEILSKGVKQRIEERCAKDPNLFRKMYLYSELFSLDKISRPGQKRLLKRNND